MTLDLEVEVAGVADTLKELGRIDPMLRKEAVNVLRNALEPLAAAARQFVPAFAPLSGMEHRGRLQWSAARVKAGIRTKVSTKANRSGQIPLASITQTNPTGAMWDMAGKNTAGRENGTSGERMIFWMTARTGQPSRAMWRPVTRYKDITESAVRDAVSTIEDMLNTELRGS